MKKIFVIEGGEYTGKTTCISLLKKKFEEFGMTPYFTREPGGCGISEEIRDVLLKHREETLDPYTELMLFSAARRAHLINKIIPIMEDNVHEFIIMDRYFYSSLVYQGFLTGANGVDGIRKALEITANVINIEYEFEQRLFLPSAVFILDMDVEDAFKRANANREYNRIDAKPMEYHERVRKGYRAAVLAMRHEYPQVKNYFVNADAIPSDIVSDIANKIMNHYLEEYMTGGFNDNI